MGVLHLLQLSQFPWQFQNLFVCIHKSELLEVNALLGKNLGHPNEVGVSTIVLSSNIISLSFEIVLSCTGRESYWVDTFFTNKVAFSLEFDNGKIWSSSFRKPHWNL